MLHRSLGRAFALPLIASIVGFTLGGCDASPTPSSNPPDLLKARQERTKILRKEYGAPRATMR